MNLPDYQVHNWENNTEIQTQKTGGSIELHKLPPVRKQQFVTLYSLYIDYLMAELDIAEPALTDEASSLVDVIPDDEKE